jgi:WXG100 family type VII secretion target
MAPGSKKQADFAGMESASAAFYEARDDCQAVADSVGMTQGVLMQIWRAPSASPFNQAMTKWGQQFKIVYDELENMAEELKRNKNDYIVQEELNSQESSKFMQILG